MEPLHNKEHTPVCDGCVKQERCQQCLHICGSSRAFDRASTEGQREPGFFRGRFARGSREASRRTPGGTARRRRASRGRKAKGRFECPGASRRRNNTASTREQRVEASVFGRGFAGVNRHGRLVLGRLAVGVGADCNLNEGSSSSVVASRRVLIVLQRIVNESNTLDDVGMLNLAIWPYQRLMMSLETQVTRLLGGPRSAFDGGARRQRVRNPTSKRQVWLRRREGSGCPPPRQSFWWRSPGRSRFF